VSPRLIALSAMIFCLKFFAWAKSTETTVSTTELSENCRTVFQFRNMITPFKLQLKESELHIRGFNEKRFSPDGPLIISIITAIIFQLSSALNSIPKIVIYLAVTQSI
jgi:hypothetical protein